MNRRKLLQYVGAAIVSVPFSTSAKRSTNQKKKIFSVLDIFDNNSQRDEIIANTASFDASIYINAAIQHATDKGLALYLPSGTYLLNGPRKGKNSAIILARSDLTMFGDGQLSILKVADDYTSGGDYRVFAPEGAERIDNLSIRAVHFDGNALKNLVHGSYQSQDIRRAYSINVLSGSNIQVTDCFFSNNPGRGVINLGNNASTSSIANALIRNNVIANVGGSIKGNRAQNDHSSIYIQANGASVEKNRFYNDAPVDPFSSPAIAVVALEIHGSNTNVTSNNIKNYVTGGNAVASVQNSENNTWFNNNFDGVTSLGLTLWSKAPYQNKNLTIRKNTFRIDNSVYSGNTAIYQNPSAAATTSPFKNLLIEDNLIYSNIVTSQPVTWHGIALCAVDGAIIRGNQIRNIQGCGIDISESKAALGVNDVAIYNNQIINVGLHKARTRIWAIRIANPSNSHLFSKINIYDNKIDASHQNSAMRGIYIDSARDLKVGIRSDNQFSDIEKSKQIQIPLSGAL